MGTPETLTCGHPARLRGKRACAHLLAKDYELFVARFVGSELNFDVLCRECAKLVDPEPALTHTMCEECFDIRDWGQEYWAETIGQPQVRKRATPLRFSSRTVKPATPPAGRLVDIQPNLSSASSEWVALTSTGELLSVDLSTGFTGRLAQLPDGAMAVEGRIALHLSPDGRFAAVVNAYGDDGLVVDLRNGATAMALKRDGYHSSITFFPIAFAELDGRTILVHATGWNRLDISDPGTGALLTTREYAQPAHGQHRPEHYKNLFWGRLTVSPDQERIASSAWGWHPFGTVDHWSLRRWLEENVWESEDGPSLRSPWWRENHWDDPMCWIGSDRLAVWGYGPPHERFPAVQIFDAVTRQPKRWFPGPDVGGGADFDSAGIPSDLGPKRWAGHVLEPWPLLLHDEFLFSLSKRNGTAVWDVASGERLLHDGERRPDRHHSGAKEFLTALPDWSFEISRLT